MKALQFYVLKEEYLDWKALRSENESYSGLAVAEDKAYEFILEQADIDYDDYLLWYVDEHPGSEPMITDVWQDKEAVVSWFFDDEWQLVSESRLKGGSK